MRLLLTLLLHIGWIQALAQTSIQGHVSNGNSPVGFANVFLKNTYDGATTDENGNFQFITRERGEQTLLVTLVGYEPFQTIVELSGETINVDIILEEVISELKAVTISAGAFAASDESRRTIFRALDIATTAGATADIAGALNTLPGTQKVGESGRLFVRGGDSEETRTFVDGMLVLDAYSPSAPSTPSRGRFLPFMFKGISFATGAYSAEYGQALSSVLALESKDESELTRTDIGLLSVGGDVTHTQAWKGGSAAAKLQYTNLRPYVGLIDQEIYWQKAPISTEAIATFRQRAGQHGIVKLFGNFSQSDFSLYQSDMDGQPYLYTLKNNYRYANASFKGVLNDRWSSRGGLSYTNLQNHRTIEGIATGEREKGLHVKALLEGSVSDQLEVMMGVEMIQRDYHQWSIFRGYSSGGARFNETISSIFAEADVYASNNFVTRVGIRGEYNSLIGQLSADPRISLAIRTGKSSQVSLAYGGFRQSVRNQYLRINDQLLPEKARHFIASYQVSEENRTLRVEGYYKTYHDLIRFGTENPPLMDNHGNGYARGIEMFWRDNGSLKNLDYWVSYSFLDTEREYLNFPSPAAPAFTSKHNFSIVAKYFVADIKSQLGATLSLASGRTYHDPNRDGFNNGITPAYRDLSFNWSYLPRPWLIIYASCTNVLGRDNIFGYEFSQSSDANGNYRSRAIRQPAPRFLFLGIFITLSKDKTVSQLPSL